MQADHTICVIRNWKSLFATDVIMGLDEIMTPFLETTILSMWHDNGARLGNTIPILRDLNQGGVCKMADCIKEATENDKVTVEDEGVVFDFGSGNLIFRNSIVYAEARVAYIDNIGRKCKLQNSCNEEEYWWVDMDKIHTSCYYKSDSDGKTYEDKTSDGKTYEDGMSDAWKLVRKLYLEEEDGGIPFSDMNEIFGIAAFRDIIKMNVKDVVKKISEWQDAKIIHVGDIVTNKFSGKRAVVADVKELEGDYLCSLIYYEDFTCARMWDNNLVKTDERIDGLDELFAKIRGDQNINQDSNAEVIEDE